MKKLLKIIAFTCFSLYASAQNWTTVTATNLTDLNQIKLVAGRFCFLGTDQNDIPISFQVGGGGQVLARPFCVNVVNGVSSSLLVPNPGTTSPSGISYRITVTDSSTGQVVLKYTKVTFVGATFQFDNYAPNFPTNPLTGATTNGNLLVNGNLTVTGGMSVGRTLTIQPNTDIQAIVAQCFNGVDTVDCFDVYDKLGNLLMGVNPLGVTTASGYSTSGAGENFIELANEVAPTNSSINAWRFHSFASEPWVSENGTPDIKVKTFKADPSFLEITEEFGVGSGSTSNGIGQNLWALSTQFDGANVTSPASATGTNPHLGIFSLSTNAASTTSGQCVMLGSSAAVDPLGNLSANTNWEFWWVFKLDNNTSQRFRIGAIGAGAAQPADGIWLRFDTSLGDTAFQACTRVASGTETCAGTTFTQDQAWHIVRFRNTAAMGTNKVGITFANTYTTLLTASEQVINSVPTNPLAPAMCMGNAVASSVEAEVDWFKALLSVSR